MIFIRLDGNRRTTMILTKRRISSTIFCKTTNEKMFPNDRKSFRTNRNIASSSITDVLISPMSRLSTSSSVMSFNSLNNSKTNPSTSTMTNSNENLDFFSSASSFLPLPTPTSSSTMSTMIDNDLQRVPHSWMLVSPSSSSTSPTYGKTI